MQLSVYSIDLITKEEPFYLEAEVVAFLCAHMQRRAPPQVPDVDLRSVT